MGKVCKKGFTLIEVISSLFIVSIVIVGTISFYNMGSKLLFTTDNQGIINANLRIAQEFIVDKVEESLSINQRSGISIDGQKLFVKDRILRYGTSSQQISIDIVKVLIDEVDKDLYRVTVVGEYETLSTIVKRGEY